MKLAHVGMMLAVSAMGDGSARGEAPVGPREQPAPQERFVCTFGGSQRLIDIYRLASAGSRGGCRVDYTKNGTTRQIWSSQADYAYCVKKAVGLVTELSKGHFSCKPQSAEPGPSAP
jgi:hypothetical protein